jgi:predicted transcriptional regulator
VDERALLSVDERMLLSEVLEALEGELIGDPGVCLQMEFTTCFAADLMSEVLAFCAPGALLVTGLANVQSVHTAHVADLKGILFVNDKRPGPEVLRLAAQNGIPLLTTKLTMFAACGVLHGRGLKPALKR